MGGAGGACGNERVAAIAMKAYPAERGAQRSAAVVIDVQGVDAAEIHRNGRRSVHDKLTRRGPDGCADGPAIEREAFSTGGGLQQAESRQRFDFEEIGRASCRERV